MEPIAELEDDDEGFGFDASSPSSHRHPNHNGNNNSSRPESPSSSNGQFRSRANTWPQFSVDYNKLAGDEHMEDDDDVATMMMVGMPHLRPMDDIRESGDNDDDHSIGPPPYNTTFYELSYHHHHPHHHPDSLDPDQQQHHHQAAYPPDEFSPVGGVPDDALHQHHHHHHHHQQQQHHHHHSHHHSTSADSHLLGQPPHSPFYSPVPGAAGTNTANPSSNQTGVSGAEFSSRCDSLDISGAGGGVIHNGDATDDALSGGGSGGLTDADAAGAAAGPDGPGTASAKSAAALKKNTSRRNAWGNMSYADLITQAINGSPDKRLTLSQIYEWMVQNVTYFKDKGDSNSSAGWKNSIRHNLSLHNRFMRVQNEGTGKSSWWMINPDAKPGKAARRRAISMETNNYEKRRGRVKRRVEQLRAGMAGIGRSDLSSSLGPLSSSSGSSSYKLVGSTSSLLSANASLSNLNLSETGPNAGHSNPHLVASPSSTESFDLFSESNPLNVGNHFHSNPSNYSPREFRPRASSNASSTCSTVNLLMDSNENHQVTPLSPLNWNADMRMYGSNGGGYHNSSHNNVHSSNSDPLQLIDCLANLGTGPSSHNSGACPPTYRMLTEEDQMLHKNGLVGCRPQESSSDMILLGSDISPGGDQAAASAASHNYTDLFKMQQQHQRLSQATSVAPVSSSAGSPNPSSQKPSFTSLDSPSNKASNNLSAAYFKTPSLMDLPPSATKLHEMSKSNSAGSLSYENSLHNRFADSRLSQNRLQALNSGLTSYQHHPSLHSPGKLSYGLGLYTTDSGCYVPDYETLNTFAATHPPLASGHDLDLDIDPVQSGMLDCDVDQVIRHELSVDGSLDFGLASSASNVDSSTTCSSSTSTKPTFTRSQNAYTMLTTNLDRSALDDHRHHHSSIHQSPPQLIKPPGSSTLVPIDNSSCYAQALQAQQLPAQLPSYYSPGSLESNSQTNSSSSTSTRTYITLAPCSSIIQSNDRNKSGASSAHLLDAGVRNRMMTTSQPPIVSMDNRQFPAQSTTTSTTPVSGSPSPPSRHLSSSSQSLVDHRLVESQQSSPGTTSNLNQQQQSTSNHSFSAASNGPSNSVDAATITAAVVSVTANNVTAASAVTVAASSHHQQHQQHVAASQQRSWVH